MDCKPIIEVLVDDAENIMYHKEYTKKFICGGEVWRIKV